MNRKTREHIESLEATLKRHNEYIAEQNKTSYALKAEIEELRSSVQPSTDGDVAQVLRNTILMIAYNMQNGGAEGYCNIATAMLSRRYTPQDLMGAVSAYAAFKAAK